MKNSNTNRAVPSGSASRPKIGNAANASPAADELEVDGPCEGRKFIKVKVSTLKTNPLQTVYMPPLSEPELRALAEDMREHGQRQPIEILPDGTIIDGHQRVEAAKILKWDEVSAVIREDLAEADEKTRTLAFLSANLNRRHMTLLARARIIKSMLEAERGCKPGGLRRDDMAELAKRVCEFMGRGHKSVERYLRVLSAPPVVQRLFEAKLLKLDHTVKIGVMMEYGQAAQATELARELEGLTDHAEIRRIVERFIPSRSGRHDHPNDAFKSFLKAIEKGAADLDGRVESVSPRLINSAAETLQNARALIGSLLSRGKKSVGAQSSLDTVSKAPSTHVAKTGFRVTHV